MGSIGEDEWEAVDGESLPEEPLDDQFDSSSRVTLAHTMQALPLLSTTLAVRCIKPSPPYAPHPYSALSMRAADGWAPPLECHVFSVRTLLI